MRFLVIFGVTLTVLVMMMTIGPGKNNLQASGPTEGCNMECSPQKYCESYDGFLWCNDDGNGLYCNDAPSTCPPPGGGGLAYEEGMVALGLLAYASQGADGTHEVAFADCTSSWLAANVAGLPEEALMAMAE